MSKDINTRFCQILLRLAVLDLTGNELRHFRQNCHAMRMKVFSGTWYLVEWKAMDVDGGTFSWEGEADNASHAKSSAINHWLTNVAPTVRARHLERGFPKEE